MFKLKNFSIIFAIIAIVPPLLAASALAQSQSIVYVDGADERAVIWTARGIKDFNTILQNLAGIFLNEAAAITDEGFVLANGFSASGISNACILQPTYAP